MLTSTIRALALALLLFGSLACGGQPEPGASPEAAQPPKDLQVVNVDRPGEAVDLRLHLAKDRTTLFEFHSDQCPPCREMEPVMDYLAEQDRTLAIRRVNIDRRGHDGIDFDSPLAEQWSVSAVPSFLIYDAKGNVVARGDQAKDKVRELYSTAQLFEHADDPGMKDISDRYRKPREGESVTGDPTESP